MAHSSSSDDSFSASGSRLLSESLPHDSETGAIGDDLSISELSLIDKQNVFSKPFSLLAKNVDATPQSVARNTDVEDDPFIRDENDERADSPDDHQALGKDFSKKREEKLQSDMFILKKLNASFAMFHDALDSTESANERIASQLEQTDALLNKYITILSKSEEYAKLIFDEEWEGADADEDTLQREYLEQKERERREAEERALAEQREHERREREERERLEQEEKDRLEQEKRERAAARGTRAVRGTRASMRAARGTASSSRPSSAASQTTTGLRRPSMTTRGRVGTTATSSRGVFRRGQ